MRDFKTSRSSSSATATRYTRTKVKANRKRKEPRPPRDWKGLFRKAAVSSKWLGLSGAVLGAGTLLFAGGKFLIVDSPFFRVDTVQVETVGHIEPEQICDISDIRRGDSMFDLDLNQIGQKIEENPWIATARVARVFPRTVSIQVTEYTPAAIVNLGCLYYVAPDGTVFKPLEPGDKIDYPLLSGMTSQELLDRPQASKQLLAGAIELLRVLDTRPAFNLRKVSEVHIDPAEGYEMLTINGGVPIRIGFDHFDTKLARLERVYPELEPRLPVMQYIDLNALDRVVVKLDPALTLPQKDQQKG